MSRPKKDGKFLNIKLQTEIYEALDRYCDEMGQTKTIAVERILKNFFKTQNISTNNLPPK